MNNKKTQIDMMKKQKYEAPALTVVEFKVERGFALSDVVPEPETAMLGDILIGYNPTAVDMHMGQEMGNNSSAFVVEEGNDGFFGNTQSGSYF